VSFLAGDPAGMEFPDEFDAIVGRLVLMYYRDPVHALANLIRHLRPGGITIFQEPDFANCRSHPCSPLFDRSVDLIKRTLSATGARTQLGLELYAVFADAGLPGPSMRMDSLIGGGRDTIGYDLVAEGIEALLPVMEKLGIATSAEIDVATLPRRLSEEVASLKGVVLSPGLIGAWSRKPAQFTAPVVNA
jgi:SAM-dependent methyltransferase